MICDTLYIQLNHMKCQHIIMWTILCILCWSIIVCIYLPQVHADSAYHEPPTFACFSPKRPKNPKQAAFLPISGTCTGVFCSLFLLFCITYRANAWFIVVLMELQFRGVLPPSGLAAQGPGNNNHLITPPGPSSSDFRNSTSLPRPVTGYDFSSRNSEPCEMEKIPPMSTGKRRGGSRKACNECKQQKVSQRKHTTFTCP